MIILNFSHALTKQQGEQIKKILSIDHREWQETRVFRVDCHLDIEKPFEDQIDDILGSFDLTDNEWSGQILVIPPPISHSALLIALGVSVKCGYMPTIARIKKKRNSRPREYVVAEIIDLQSFLDRKRSQKKNNKKVTIKRF